MSVYLDKKYVNLVSPRLERFSKKSDFLWNFRCPFCGDSSKNTFKARGYFYRRKNDVFFTCHNCNVSMGLANFLKTNNRTLFEEYNLEKFKESNGGNVKAPDFDEYKTTAKLNKRFATTINLPTIRSLPQEHFAKRYIIDRKIPTEFYDSLYYAEDFKLFIEELLPDNEKIMMEKEKRIVIPFYDENNVLIGIQGRALEKTKAKYITMKLSDENKKIFGLNKVNTQKPIYVFEGPFDSMFIQNAVATMDSALYSIIKTLGPKDYVFVSDNEPRNPAILAGIKKMIGMGLKVCIWPPEIKEKDVNEMILSGRSSAEVQHVIDTHTFEGLNASLEFLQWKKM